MGQYDIALRHIALRCGGELAQGLRFSFPVESVSWVETQLTALERKIDRVLELRGGGERRLVQLEFIVAPGKDLAIRMFEYAVLLVLSLRAAADPGRGDEALPPVESVAVLLSGRAAPWPLEGQFRTNWPESTRFCGQRFRIEAVYQRKVAELMARPGVFWLVFTPLAVDVTEDSIRQVVEELRRREPRDEQRAELYAVMQVLAELAPWGHTWSKEIRMRVQELDEQSILASETLREVFEQGRRQGIEAMLRGVLTRRLRRELSAAEQAAVANRASSLDDPQAAAAVFELDTEALLAWLLGPDAE
ncbi:hypothetical protein SOCE26_025090 [Sorangium cellulosum]|uniref:DUF4351 domain-containing protein n=1 Tax=Sorangium cellulosum TaxID=56 RepID=A0A2L0EP74_SORCE|nr:hypothetical protein [Sorangium cellulosum]AUX41104.1 hypothetical protein SOCE26_025090 [Sorangium cellulosum]